MNIQNPQALYILLFIPLIVILHMIRRQRKLETVSSLFLWRIVLRKNPSTFRRRIRENVNLILQILAVLCAAAALSDPSLDLPAASSRDSLVIVLDLSASMTVKEGRETRFNAARKEATRLARAPRRGGTALILAGGTPELAVPFTRERRDLLSAIASVEPTLAAGDMEAALEAAFALSTGGAPPEVALVSDGAFDLPENRDFRERGVRFIQVGSRQDNAGITRIAARESPAAPGTVDILLSVLNAGRAAWEREIVVSGDGVMLSRFAMTLAAGEEKTTTISIPSGYAEVVCAFDGGDPLPADDTARVALRNRERSRVLLVSEGNYHLETLLSVFPSLSVVIEPEYESAAWDLVIFDSSPPDSLPPGNYLFLGYLPKHLPLQAEERVDFPRLDSWIPEHPFLRSVDPRSFSVYRCLETRYGGRMVPVLGGEPPLLYAYDDGKTKAALFTFPLAYSNLSLQTAFPILVGNIVEWLVPGSTGEPYHAGRAGTRITSEAHAGADAGILTTPEGASLPISPLNGLFSFLSRSPGLHTLEHGGTRELFAVNVAAAEETDISPRARIGSADEARKGETSAGGSGSSAAIGQAARGEATGQGGRRTWKLFAVLLLAAAAADLLFDKKKRGLPLLRPAYITVMLAAAVAAVLVSLAEPTIRGKGNSLSLMFLVDSSGSVPTMERDTAVRWAEEAARHMGKDDSAGLVLFGSTPLVAAAPEAGAVRFPIRSLPDSNATDMESAFRQALSLLPSQGDRRIVLLSDGNENRGSLRDLLRGVPALPVSVVPLNTEHGQNEVTARSMTMPARVSAGEPFTITIEAESLEPAAARAIFFLDGEYLGEDRLALPGGRALLSYTVELEEPGFHSYEVALEADEDGTMENNVFRKAVIAEGDPLVLYVHPEGESSPDLLSALAAQGFTFHSITPESFPETLLGLLSYKAVILDDIPAYDLSIEKMDLLRRAVSGGTGLLALGGDSSFGAGGYYRTPLEQALPVDMDISSSTDIPSLVLLMIIDKSGSMGDSAGEGRRKIDLAKQAVHSAAEVLNPAHLVGILAFDVGHLWAVPMIPASDTSIISGGLFPIEPGGGTNLYPALEEGYRVLAATPGAVKHILILSDGLTEEGDFRTLCGDIREDGITISTVAVGSDADRNLMEQIALWGRGRSYFTEDIRNVPAIFASESLKVSRRLKVEETFIPSLSLPHEILGGLRAGDIPPLHGFMLSYAKPNSQVLLTGVEENPLLAVMQYGLGRSAAFTSSLSSFWSREWRRWEGFGRIFAQTLRWVSRGAGDTRISWRIARSRGTAALTVEMADPDAGFVNGMILEARILAPDGRESSVPLPQIAPGRYAAEFPVPASGTYVVPIVSAGTVLDTALLSIPYPEEYLMMTPDLDFLGDVAGMTGGRVFGLDAPPDADFYEPDPGSGPQRFPLWPLLLLAGFLLYLAEVLFRFYPPALLRRLVGSLPGKLLASREKKETLTYGQLRGIIEKERIEREEKKPDLSYWFGTDRSAEDALRLYIAKIRKNGKGEG